MVQTALWPWTLARTQARMARANCLPTTFDSIGVEYAPRALRWILSARSLEFPLQTIDIRRVNWTVAKHNIRSEGEGTFYFLDHARKGDRENGPVSRR